MSTFARTDTSVVGHWWWTVDRWSLLAIGLMLAIGALLSLAASPYVAERIGLETSHFARRHFAFLLPCIAVLAGMSMMSPRGVRRVAVLGLLVGLLLTLATLFVGVEAKGATRWLALGGLSLQPSEFVKPCFVVVAAWLLSVRDGEHGPAAALACCLLFAAIVTLLVLQPDFGMAAVVTAIWFAQLFVAGLPMLWVGMLVLAGIGATVLAYVSIPHVTSRVDRFFDPASGDSYQIDRAMEAFSHGGLLGRGPGEGTVKEVLPDAHTDFIFSVAGEEFGLLACLLIVGLFAFIALRGFMRLLRERELFVLLAASGLLMLFCLQAVINIGVNLNLLPTKGMTLPLISYGGSSLLATAMGVGMMLALTRRRPGQGSAP